MAAGKLVVNMTKGDEENYSRKEIELWINFHLGEAQKINKIEEMATGANYCYLLNILYPGVIQMKNVSNTKHERHAYRNLKLLQRAFVELGIDMEIPIAAIIGNSFKANFEFAKKFISFFNLNFKAPDGIAPPKEVDGAVPNAPNEEKEY